MSPPSLRDFHDNGARGGSAPAPADARPGRFHRSMPGYAPSPLADAPGAAELLGLERLFVKMEVERFGLPSFKILGASWAVCRALSARAARSEPAATFGELRELAADEGGLTLVAATDGNHGRAVARMARLLGLGARILVPEHAAAARIEAIAGEGADVEVVRGSYDDAVALAAAAADERRLVISDTSWPGYEEVPGWVADGYSTIFEELAAQLPAPPPLVALQIGVGALASAAVRALCAPGRVLGGVEPDDAACALAAVRAGAPVLVSGPHRSVMAGLSCGLASQVALPDMARGIAAFCAIDDRAAERAVRMLLANGLACGETGASGVAGLVALREAWGAASWERLGAGSRPAALALCTEAPTDPVSFARITAGG
ncbi:MAG: diaminopropionate ammonia-lyase [Solirubrobacteraceae bacterium]|nr:diaminopropionate ammonia-lyase [Solirubrobacteraceae bacterium]